MSTTIKAGDFTGLADDYAKNRPDYAPSVLTALLSLTGKATNDIDFADVGAGTGIWTRMVWQTGVKSVQAVEPNDDMRRAGSNGVNEAPGFPTIQWHAGSAEHTTLADHSVDMLSMASSFHWADFAKATAEFHRVLRPGGRFVALWNPRLIETNPVLVDIENYLNTLRPDIKRVSSGRSGITETLTEQLWASPHFDDVVYLEGRHTIAMSKERYMGAWRSVNDLQAQLGPEKFSQFLAYVEDKIAPLAHIDATYLTRAWSARAKG